MNRPLRDRTLEVEPQPDLSALLRPSGDSGEQRLTIKYIENRYTHCSNNHSNSSNTIIHRMLGNRNLTTMILLSLCIPHPTMTICGCVPVLLQRHGRLHKQPVFIARNHPEHHPSWIANIILLMTMEEIRQPRQHNPILNADNNALYYR